ncbi:hypothetical protein [Nocardia noduli]|nr:hypothetical protein [Nocardia noduli]
MGIAHHLGPARVRGLRAVLDGVGDAAPPVTGRGRLGYLLQR